jgi:hypothetical protein
MMNRKIESEIKRRLKRIKALSKEIEDVPTLLPDLWTMKGIDKKCQEIVSHAQWIEEKLGILCVPEDWGGNGSQSEWGSKSRIDLND